MSHDEERVKVDSRMNMTALLVIGSILWLGRNL